MEEYVRGVGISDWTLRRWLKEAKRSRRARGAGDRRGFVPVIIGSEAGETGRVEVVLPEGTMLRVPVTIGAAQLEALVSAVRRAC